MSPTRPAPMRMTSVPPAFASASQSTSAAPLGGILVAGHNREMRRRPAVCHGDSGVRRRADGAGDAGHDLERHTGRRQRLGLLAATPEHERVATLEPDDGAPGTPVLDEERVDVGLLDLGPAGRLPDVDALGVGRRELQQRRVHEPVVDDDVGAAEHLGAAHGEQSRVTGPRPHEEHGHISIVARRARRRARGARLPRRRGGGPPRRRPRQDRGRRRSARNEIRPSSDPSSASSRSPPSPSASASAPHGRLQPPPSSAR